MHASLVNVQTGLTATGEGTFAYGASEVCIVFVSRPRVSRGVVLPGVITRVENPKIEKAKVFPQQRPPPPTRKQAANMARMASDALN
jgi:hypothetical protein